MAELGVSAPWLAASVRLRYGGAKIHSGGGEPQSTLFTLGRYMHCAWVTNMDQRPLESGTTTMGVPAWNLESGGREDYALRKIPTASFAANALYLETSGLPTTWSLLSSGIAWRNPGRSPTLQKLRYKLFLLPGELTRPQNRLSPSPPGVAATTGSGYGHSPQSPPTEADSTLKNREIHAGSR